VRYTVLIRNPSNISEENLKQVYFGTYHHTASVYGMAALMMSLGGWGVHYESIAWLLQRSAVLPPVLRQWIAGLGL
jgi:hypothetical protein